MRLLMFIQSENDVSHSYMIKNLIKKRTIFQYIGQNGWWGDTFTVYSYSTLPHNDKIIGNHPFLATVKLMISIDTSQTHWAYNIMCVNRNSPLIWATFNYGFLFFFFWSDNNIHMIVVIEIKWMNEYKWIWLVAWSSKITGIHRWFNELSILRMRDRW